MIVSYPLDLPKIEPDDWDVFMKIWNENSDYITKTDYLDQPHTSAISLGQHTGWKGIEIINRKPNNWSAPFVDIKTLLPKMYNQLANLPIPDVQIVRVLSAQGDIPLHQDSGFPLWEIRAFLKCQDPSIEWYFTANHDKQTKVPLRMPTETNWFTWEDSKCYHGTRKLIIYPKFLIVLVYDGVLPEDLAKRSFEKYKEYAIDLPYKPLETDYGIDDTMSPYKSSTSG